jgi:hypothetical protein
MADGVVGGDSADVGAGREIGYFNRRRLGLGCWSVLREWMSLGQIGLMTQ